MDAPGPVKLTIDHVTIAGPALEPMQQAFARLGLPTDYGGPHSNGITHMALLGFNDGSYLELISTLRPGQKEAVFWGEHIAGNAGPCAWAVQVADIAAEVARVSAAGVPVDGPAYYHRRRPDGVLVEWHLAILGAQGAGAKLPFLIKDITPRRWRVTPSASVSDGLLTGIAGVVLGVKSLEESVALFRQVYHWPAPAIQKDPLWGAELACFEETPVVLAAPPDKNGWLAERLARFGESPCAYLIGTAGFDTACKRFAPAQTGRWFNRPVAWFNPAQLHGARLGILG